jgi:hypothetical protein
VVSCGFILISRKIVEIMNETADYLAEGKGGQENVP